MRMTVAFLAIYFVLVSLVFPETTQQTVDLVIAFNRDLRQVLSTQ